MKKLLTGLIMAAFALPTLTIAETVVLDPAKVDKENGARRIREEKAKSGNVPVHVVEPGQLSKEEKDIQVVEPKESGKGTRRLGRQRNKALTQDVSKKVRAQDVKVHQVNKVPSATTRTAPTRRSGTIEKWRQ